MDQELKNSLKNINDNQTLSKLEKNKRKQEIIKSFYDNKNKLIKTKKIECSHYPNKKCNHFYFDCCKKYYECVRCHNENENHLFKLKHITCKLCNREQSINASCIQCHISFSNTYCEICCLFSDQEHIFHCDQCGICRVGKKDEMIHCTECNACFKKEEHQCIQSISKDSECCFCGDIVFNSMNSSTGLKCGHFAHVDCLNNSLKNNSYKCGFCRKTFLDAEQSQLLWSQLNHEISLTQIPLYIQVDQIYQTKFGLFKLKDKNGIDENNMIQFIEHDKFVKGVFINWDSQHEVIININELKLTKESICNDCSLNNYNLFHIFGIKCNSCGSYNVS